MWIFICYVKVFQLPLAVVSYVKNHFKFLALQQKYIYTNLKVSFFNVMHKEMIVRKTLGKR